MILMSCENVQEKSEQFKQEFATAITNGKFEDAERIANDAQTYYEGLSDSNKKKYETYFPKFKVILAAKKFNKQWRDACSVVDPTKTLEFPSLDKIEKEAKQYMAGLDQQDAETFKAELTDLKQTSLNIMPCTIQPTYSMLCKRAMKTRLKNYRTFPMNILKHSTQGSKTCIKKQPRPRRRISSKS